MIPCWSLITGPQNSFDNFKIDRFIQKLPYRSSFIDSFIEFHFTTYFIRIYY